MKIKIIFLFFVFIFLLPVCFAFYINVPAIVSVEKVRAGGYAEEEVWITGDNELPLQIKLSSAGIIKYWVSFEPNEFYLEKEETVNFKVIIKPPEGIDNGFYEGFIVVDILPVSENEITSSVSSSADVKLRIEITDEEIRQVIVDYIDVKDIVKGAPIEVSVTAENKGNVLVNPLIKTEVLNEDRSLIAGLDSSKNIEIFPLSKKIISNSIPNNLGAGNYWLHIVVSLDDRWLLYEQTSSFGVYLPEEYPSEEEEEKITEFKPIELRTSPVVLIIWILVVIFIIWKMYSWKKNKRTKTIPAKKKTSSRKKR